ncbi:MAG: SusC/RagA family TonB-linked outer membrane protein [Bacteroides sp.]|nr:SusC/RagA family TonB-linked outer membrane protein [Bacteroides sp.]
MVRGTVTDAGGAPLIGVNVVEKGTTNGNITDLEGNFLLNVSPGAVLQFSYVGYVSQETEVKDQTTIYIRMVEDMEIIDEVVVVGYGTQKKADLTSAISILNPAEVLKAPGGVENALQGNIAGVNVSGGKIRIRGTSSITGNTDPLWVVDGIIDGNIPNDDEIESIQVLKDAASAAIYGVRGANGVIVITTKRGTIGSPRVNFNTYIGTGSPAKKLKMLGAYDYAVYANELFYNAATPEARADGTWNLSVPSNNANPSNPMVETDWWDEYFFSNFYQKYDLAISGGGDLLNYRFGATYTVDDRNGVARNNQNQNVYSNVQGTRGRFTYGGRIQLSYTNNHGTSMASLQNTLQLPPNEPVYDESNMDINRGYYQTGMGDGLDIPNQIFFVHEDRNKTKSHFVITSVFGEVKLFDWLKFKATYSYTHYNPQYTRFVPRFTLASGGGGGTQAYNLLETRNNGNSRHLTDWLLTFDKNIGLHSLSGVAGIVSEKFETFNRTFAGRSQEQTDFGVEIYSRMISLFRVPGVIWHTIQSWGVSCIRMQGNICLRLIFVRMKVQSLPKVTDGAISLLSP